MFSGSVSEEANFAGEPDVYQPIAFTIDERGRLWVVENYSYPDWSPYGRDRIVIFERGAPPHRTYARPQASSQATGGGRLTRSDGAHWVRSPLLV